jgi:isopenicillin N synthase-like dioxygenase
MLLDAIRGLEVRVDPLTWIAVPRRPGALVAVVGDMLECWSGGLFRATSHRVRPEPCRERYTIAYFATPHYQTDIQPLVWGAPGGPRFAQINAGRRFADYLSEFE